MSQPEIDSSLVLEEYFLMNSSITALVEGEIMVFERILIFPFFAAISFNLSTSLESTLDQDSGLLLKMGPLILELL